MAVLLFSENLDFNWLPFFFCYLINSFCKWSINKKLVEFSIWMLLRIQKKSFDWRITSCHRWQEISADSLVLWFHQLKNESSSPFRTLNKKIKIEIVRWKFSFKHLRVTRCWLKRRLLGPGGECRTFYLEVEGLIPSRDKVLFPSSHSLVLRNLGSCHWIW